MLERRVLGPVGLSAHHLICEAAHPRIHAGAAGQTLGFDTRPSTRLRFSIPSVSQKRRIYRPPDPVRRDDVWLGVCIIEDRLNLGYAAIDAGAGLHPQLEATDIGSDLSANNLLRFLCFLPLLRCFDELLCSKGDEHADRDDTHFTDELAPALR